MTVAGRALTVTGELCSGLTRDDYFLPYLEMLGSIQPGDVVVSQPNDLTLAHFGELSAETAKYRGGRGVVVNGGIRDVDYILKLGFPAFARYTTPLDIVGRWRLTDCNVPVVIGRTKVFPGDYVVGDRDGVAVIPKEVAEEVIARAEACVATESDVRKAILNGVHPVQAYREYGRF
jgi:regulator of RNase E activity RraA